MTTSSCIRLTDKNFKEEVLESKIPVFVDFWGSWCPPCKMIEPIIDELAEQLRGTVKVGKLSVDQNPKIRSMFTISAAPTFMVFKYGKVMCRSIGSMSKKQLLEMIETALAEVKEKQEIAAVNNTQGSTPKADNIFEKV